MHGLENAYSNLQNYCILGLLPHYISNGDSSLVYMVNYLIEQSTDSDSDMYLNDRQSLLKILKKKTNTPILLFGVTYALLELAAEINFNLTNNIIVIETGGMKGRGKEITKEQLHTHLKNKFGTENIHSEYGMTELLSQAYSKENTIFSPAPTLKVLCRDYNDPLQTTLIGKGALNIIDLSNIHSCSFIATQDVGEVYDNGTFKINGRMDNSDIRGCNMLL
jgi:hypothetical protein